MQDHHLQREILHKLVTSDSLRFSDLRPDGIDSNTVTYHIQQLIKQNLVTKIDNGLYALTELGKVAGINVTLSKKELLEQAHSIILMVLKDNNKWLLRKRKAQPMYEKVGFVHGEPIASEPITKTAKDLFLDRTGLSADFTPKGFGYVKLWRADKLESFVHFTLLEAANYSGTLKPEARNGENSWYETPDFNAAEMIPSMPEIAIELNKPGIFYLDLSFDIS